MYVITLSFETMVKAAARNGKATAEDYLPVICTVLQVGVYVFSQTVHQAMLEV